MKQHLMRLQDLLNEVDIPVASVSRLIYLNLHLYTCFSIALENEFDIDEYSSSLEKVILYYLTLPIMNTDNRISFIKNFYESYSLYPRDEIVRSVSDEKSLIFDNSLESYIGRVLAIADRRVPKTSREIFENLEKSLLELKNEL